jgi:8-oxo-dGTP pyrophosphatase MutT (NUDIX family)
VPPTEPTPPLPADPPPFAPFRVERSVRIYDSRWCGLRRDHVVTERGAELEHHVFEIPDAVVVVPATSSGGIVLIGQYRYPHGRTHWEIPAGRIAAGETPEQAAARELREETGCVARRIERLAGFYPINGISDHYAHAFAALGCERVHDLELEASERILPRELPRGDVRALLRAGKLDDAFTALALFHYFERHPDDEPRH